MKNLTFSINKTVFKESTYIYKKKLSKLHRKWYNHDHSNVQFRLKVFSTGVVLFPWMHKNTICDTKFCILGRKSIHISSLISWYSNLVKEITQMFSFSWQRLRSFLVCNTFIRPLGVGSTKLIKLFGLVYCISVLSLSRNLARVCQSLSKRTFW